MRKTLALFLLIIAVIAPSTQWAQELVSPAATDEAPAVNNTSNTTSSDPTEPRDLGPAVAPRPAGPGGDYAKQFVHMLLSLGFILVLMLVGAWVLKRMMSQRMLQANSSSAIKVLERRALSPKASVYLVEVNGQGLLVGETATGLEKLGDISLAGTSGGRSFEDVYRAQEASDDTK